MPEKWRRKATRLVGDFRVFRLLEHEAQAPHDGKERTVHTIEACDWVNVVALTPDQRVVMVRQYRHGLDDITLEIPGGMCDPGESPIVAAARELREETGYASPEALVPLGWLAPNPATHSNRCHVFLARAVTQVGSPEPDAGEDLEVVTEPITGMGELMRSGVIRHALVMAAFMALELRPELMP